MFAFAMLVEALLMFFLYRYGSQRDKAIADSDKLAEDLRRANEMKSVFVQNMSHEIRTPLNAIVGFTQLLSMPDGFLSDEEKAQYAEYVNVNSDILTMLIDDLLSLSDVESGKYNITISEAGVNRICQQAMKTVEFRVPPGVDFKFTTELDDSYMVKTDSRRAQQVLINFLTNACKHTSQGQIHLHCSIAENPGKVTFSVTDTGSGIPAEKASDIFERFIKLDSFKQGTGLGLSICKEIADRLGGSVGLDTSYTGGARFLFIINAAR